ncbi:MAG: TIGR03084 family protein [Acidimicrobiales bacterium]|nr:TIGR03084 family protein [Acidimicrobiales bacterium]
MKDPEFVGCLRDLSSEVHELSSLLGEIDLAAWKKITPSTPWSIQDSIGHLAYFDRVQALAIEEAGAFQTIVERFVNYVGDPMEEHLKMSRSQDPSETLTWWKSSSTLMRGAFQNLEGFEKLPWFGPPMRAISALRARVMETWAHGQDIYDALGLKREATPRIYHVVHLGHRTVGWSFLSHGLEAPKDGIRFEIHANDGKIWEFGDPSCQDVIITSALDLALLVTQRRHRDDLTIEATGDNAKKWVEIAQVFAGPSGTGRKPLSEQ